MLRGPGLVVAAALAAAACGSLSSEGADAAAAPDGTVPSGGYDEVVLADHPVAYWAMDHAAGSEPDLSGHGHAGTYPQGTKAQAPLPNGDLAADFDGATQHLSVPSSAAFSIPTTGSLTWEAWIRPDVLQFPHDDGSDGYVDWMGKCEDYAPTCEWEARPTGSPSQGSSRPAAGTTSSASTRRDARPRTAPTPRCTPAPSTSG